MRKLYAIVKREYLQRVRAKLFIVATLLGPFVMSFFAVVPALIFSIDAGGPDRIAVVDQTGRMYRRVEAALAGAETDEDELPSDEPERDAAVTKSDDRSNQLARSQTGNLVLEEAVSAGRSLDEVKRDLNQRISRHEIDGYLVLPADLLEGARAQFFGRHTGDLFKKRRLEDGVSRAVREERLAHANIDANVVKELSRPVDLLSYRVGERGEERDRGEGFILVFACGFVIYLTILIYGQVILGAVIEEKETRIAEILFSSVKPFTLMSGKLIGVSLVALTQLCVWVLTFLGFSLFGVGMLASRGFALNLPHLQPLVYVYFVLFFLLGYFIYSTIYALVGSIVTTAQEGGQLALPIILLLAIGFYLAFPVIRSPDSSLAFWVSMFPFFSPITMLVRIVTQTPPFWQIALSLLIGFGTVVLLAWLASRIYRVGMLMYGKRATIPEAWRWLRQS
ncbi:MAG: ABC transporter permease [Pyrinomonadaceae bacterium]